MGRVLYCAFLLAFLAMTGDAALADGAGAPIRAGAGDGIVIPEPATLGLMAVGFAAVFYRRRPRATAR